MNSGLLTNLDKINVKATKPIIIEIMFRIKPAFDHLFGAIFFCFSENKRPITPKTTPINDENNIPSIPKATEIVPQLLLSQLQLDFESSFFICKRKLFIL